MDDFSALHRRDCVAEKCLESRFVLRVTTRRRVIKKKKRRKLRRIRDEKREEGKFNWNEEQFAELGNSRYDVIT